MIYPLYCLCLILPPRHIKNWKHAMAEGTGNKTDAASNQGNSSMEASNNESNVVALVRTGNTLTETAGNGNETDDDMMEEMNNDTNANNESNVVALVRTGNTLTETAGNGNETDDDM